LNIKPSIKTTRAFIRKVKIKKRKAKNIPGKADPIVQEEFIQKILIPLSQKVMLDFDKMHVFFMDAAHIVNGKNISGIWSQERKAVKSGSGRQRVNIVAAVDPFHEKYVITPFPENVNEQALKKFLRQVRYSVGSKEKPIVIVLDNARYQKTKRFRSLAQSLNIQLEYLPPYSPNLNLCERMWKYFRGNYINNNYFQNQEEILEVMKNFKADCEKDVLVREELKTLLSYKFERLGKYQVQNIAS